MDLVSILIPVHNTGIYLRDCLNSVLNQTYTNLEIIVVDDGSTDPVTLEILKEFEQKDHRIKVIYSPTNHGVAYVRALGMEHVTAPYFSLLDSDDRFKPDFVERMHQAIVDNGTDAAVCNITNFVLDQNIPYVAASNWLIKDQGVVKNADFKKHDTFMYMPIRVYALMVKTESYKNANMSFDTGLIGTEDFVWCQELFLKLESFYYLDYVGLERLLRDGSIVHSRNDLFYLNILKAFARRKELLKQYDLLEQHKPHLIKIALPHVLEALKSVKDPQIKAQISKLSTEILEGMTGKEF